ncbi:unnamed protein product [Protopolystoma xenopodis]|uniref:Uncharacterized protein n=1 Tax=Protopolystoma xenopodis TaxID=117903 RepID=A0A3S5CN19_9PLAT|nr:unnamed protein product [Protopolystoma xenopodis]
MLLYLWHFDHPPLSTSALSFISSSFLSPSYFPLKSGHHPLVRVWSLLDGSQLAEFPGHHFRVDCVRFSPLGDGTRFLVSLGSQEDQTLNVWDRISGHRLATAKLTHRVRRVFEIKLRQMYIFVLYLVHKIPHIFC